MTSISHVMTMDTSSPTMISLTTSKAFTGWVGSLGVSLLRLMNPTSVIVPEIENRITRTTIDDLFSPRYRVIAPIPVEIEYCADDEFIANWPAGGIAITSDSATDALQTLKVEIVEIYQIFKNERLLGPEPQRQLSLLERHLGQG